MMKMEDSSGTVLTVLLAALLHTIPLSQPQPTVQNAFWRSPESSPCSNNNNNNNDNDLKVNPQQGTFRLSSLQSSVEMAMLELQRQAVDAETLRQDVHALHRRHEDSRRLLLQLTDSVNLLVKELVKTPPCPARCTSAGGDGDDGGGGGGGGDGGGGGGGRPGGAGGGRGREGRGGGGGGGGGGSVRRGFLPEDEDVDQRVARVPDSSQRLSGDGAAGAEGGGAQERVLMDQTGASVPPRPRPGPVTPRQGEMPQDLGVDRSRVQVGGRDGDPPFAAAGTTTTTTSATVTTTRSGTATLDPIHRMYNGSIPKDCDDIRALGYVTNGTYVIQPSAASRSVVVLCEFQAGEVWTLIQRRRDGAQDFYRPWGDYKRGFGDLRGEFWIGNEVLHQMTSQGFYRLKIDMWEWPRAVSQSEQPLSRYYFAESRYFHVSSEEERYRMHVPDDYFAYRGFGGSGLRIHAGPFLTKDVRDLPAGMRENCAQIFHCGWWFTTCVRNANFNGRYYKGGYADAKDKTRARDDIYWPNIDQSLYRVVMKIGRVNESYALGT